MPTLQGLLEVFGYDSVLEQSAFLLLLVHETKESKWTLDSDFATWANAFQWIQDVTQRCFRFPLITLDTLDERKGMTPLQNREAKSRQEVPQWNETWTQLRPSHTREPLALAQADLIVLIGDLWSEVETCLDMIPSEWSGSVIYLGGLRGCLNVERQMWKTLAAWLNVDLSVIQSAFASCLSYHHPWQCTMDLAQLKLYLLQIVGKKEWPTVICGYNETEWIQNLYDDVSRFRKRQMLSVGGGGWPVPIDMIRQYQKEHSVRWTVRHHVTKQHSFNGQFPRIPQLLELWYNEEGKRLHAQGKSIYYVVAPCKVRYVQAILDHSAGFGEERHRLWSKHLISKLQGHSHDSRIDSLVSLVGPPSLPLASPTIKTIFVQSYSQTLDSLAKEIWERLAYIQELAYGQCLNMTLKAPAMRRIQLESKKDPCRTHALGCAVLILAILNELDQKFVDVCALVSFAKSVLLHEQDQLDVVAAQLVCRFLQRRGIHQSEDKVLEQQRANRNQVKQARKHLNTKIMHGNSIEPLCGVISISSFCIQHPCPCQFKHRRTLISSLMYWRWLLVTWMRLYFHVAIFVSGMNPIILSH